MTSFTHIDEKGRVRMVNISGKDPTTRTAIAHGKISMNSKTFDKIRDKAVKKGNVLETARIAGIMAAKKTAELIPMCQPLNITHAQIDFFPEPDASDLRIEAMVRVHGQTGVEMEAMTAVTVAALTIYDMCKSYDKTMSIHDIYLLEKTGGQSGTFKRQSKKYDNR